MNAFSQIDKTLYDFSNSNTSDLDIKSLRLDIRKVIFDKLKAPENNEFSLIDVIDDIKNHPDSPTRRDLALFYVRLLAFPRLLPEKTSDNRRNTRLIELFNITIPDFFERFKIDKKAQNHEQINKFQSIDDEVYSWISILATKRTHLAEFNSARKDLQKNLNNPLVNSYFKVYGYNEIKESVIGLLTRISDIHGKNIDDVTLAHELDSLSTTVSLAINESENQTGRLFLQLYCPFLKYLEQALNEYKDKLDLLRQNK